MARPRATASQKEAVRSRIRKAAAELYREQGVANLTARAIAVRAGVSVGTIYVHFGNLSELARSLWQGPVDRFEVKLRELARQEADPLARIRQMLGAYLEFAHAYPDLYRGTFLFVRPPTDEVPDRQDFTVNAFAQLLIDALEEGRQAGLFTFGDARTQAQMMWSALHGSLSLPINLDRFEWETFADQDVVENILNMIRGPS